MQGVVVSRYCVFLFEPELALLVGLQVVSSKEGGGGRREGALSDKFLVASGKRSGKIVGMGKKLSYINVRLYD